MPPCLVGMEPCVGAHHFSRRLKALGHDARLMPAKYVRPYPKGQKNDFRDAEAVQRSTMKFVATKTADQLDRRQCIGARAAGQVSSHQIRAFLLERGVAVRQGQRFLRGELPRILSLNCCGESLLLARVGHRRPSIIRPLSRTAELAGNGCNGRKSAIKDGVLDARFGPELQRQPTARPSAGERRADLCSLASDHRRRQAQLRSRIPAAHGSALIPNIILKRSFPPTS
jgi:hypothetical protein